jgi:hypothetical protein
MNADVITDALNDRFSSLFSRSGRCGRYVYQPNICCVCDEFTNTRTNRTLSISRIKDLSYLISKSNERSYHEGCAIYSFDGYGLDGTIPWEQLLLSPSTKVVKCMDGSAGLVTCINCITELEKYNMPVNAIANNFCFGNPPDFLTSLTDVEVAFLSPVKTYGYCFAYTGGFQKELKGMC